MTSASPRRLCVVFALLSAVLTAPVCAQTDPPPTYYDAAIGKSGAALKAALHAAIQGHTVLPYTSTATDTWDALKVLDEDPLDASRVTLIYSGGSALKSDQYTGTSGTWNREHLWPQSYGLNALSANSRAKSDVLNLRAALASVNSSRGNKFYDWSTAPISAPAGAPGTSYDVDSWEPRDGDKGAAARAIFYMAVRYEGTDADVPDLEVAEAPDLALHRFGNLTTLLAWNRQFPVTTAERQRNHRVFTDYQYNRNPFIDRPENADMVFLGLTPSQAWRNVHFTAAELGNPIIGGDDADPDRDGISNLLEYAFHRNPRQANHGPAMVASVASVSGASFLYLEFVWDRFATDLEFSFEGSANLQTWLPVTAEVVSETVADFGTERVTVRCAPATAPYFVRLRVTK